MANVENILKVADAIENNSIEGLGFNMGVFKGDARIGLPDMSGHNCGTVACIAGWAYQLFGKTVSSDPSEILGLNGEEAEALFLPNGWSIGVITTHQAIRTLRNLAETGKVDWTA